MIEFLLRHVCVYKTISKRFDFLKVFLQISRFFKKFQGFAPTKFGRSDNLLPRMPGITWGHSLELPNRDLIQMLGNNF